MKLHRLAPEAHCLVTEPLARGTIDRYASPDYERFLDEIDMSIDLDALDQSLDDIIAAIPRYDGALEQRAAPAVHRALSLTRRAAADPGIWRFLAVVHRPDVVRHRWAVEAWATTRTRYWTPGMRHDSNVFSRLWWIAELTREGDDYSLTERAFSKQTLAIQVFIRRYAWHRDAVVALLDVLHDARPRVIERVTRNLLGVLGTLVLEALAFVELRALISELRLDAERATAEPDD